MTDKDFTFFVPVSPAPDLECIPGLGLDLGLDSSARSGCIQRTARCTASTQDRAPVGGIARPTNGTRDAGSGAAGMSGGLPLSGLQRPNRGWTLPS